MEVANPPRELTATSGGTIFGESHKKLPDTRSFDSGYNSDASPGHVGEMDGTRSIDVESPVSTPVVPSKASLSDVASGVHRCFPTVVFLIEHMKEDSRWINCDSCPLVKGGRYSKDILPGGSSELMLFNMLRLRSSRPIYHEKFTATVAPANDGIDQPPTMSSHPVDTYSIPAPPTFIIRTDAHRDDGSPVTSHQSGSQHIPAGAEPATELNRTLREEPEKSTLHAYHRRVKEVTPSTLHQINMSGKNGNILDPPPPNHPWMVIGGLNTVTSADEKRRVHEVKRILFSINSYEAPRPDGSLISLKEHLFNNLCTNIGNGRSTPVWFDKWLSSGELASQIEANPPYLCSHVRVSYFLSNGQWKVQRLQRWAPPSLLPHIMSCPLQSDPSHDDVVKWTQPSFTKFSMAGAYHALYSMPPPSDPLAKTIWKIQVPAKMKFHLWRLPCAGHATYLNPRYFDADFNWFLGISRRIISSCVLLITFKEALVQAWAYRLDHLEIDLGRELIDELQAGPEGCRSYLRGTITEVRELLDRNWTVAFNHAKRPANIVAVVLAFS
ncbi:hypothetical protein Cgig2_028081 [Carnegiea gigantea]|uniref:RNase H type-1 domain-containing protein n=1 Tax=Carnegiea gigantea TaxID=171969 RepID=A0A9Q1KII0_9CARY|nr:hypothetical protein Cgig2_028081 [Carnegiea gigantea]